MAQSKSPRSSESPKRKPTRDAKTVSPAVIVDFIFDGGLFFISVNNISELPAYKVSTKFDHKLVGLGGAKEISALPLFRNIEFLAPGKAIRTFLDSSDSYFARKQPTRITAQVSYRDAEGEKHKISILHDLEIYRELPFIGKPQDVATVTDEVTDEGE